MCVGTCDDVIAEFGRGGGSYRAFNEGASACVTKSDRYGSLLALFVLKKIIVY